MLQLDIPLSDLIHPLSIDKDRGLLGLQLKEECAREGYLMSGDEADCVPSQEGVERFRKPPMYSIGYSKKYKTPLAGDAMPKHVIVLLVNSLTSAIQGPSDEHLRPLRKCAEFE